MKNTNNNRAGIHKMGFLYQQGDFQKAINCKVSIYQHGVQCVLKNSEETREEV